MSQTAPLEFDEGCTILMYDGANAFNSISPHRLLSALAKCVHSVVPCEAKVYTGKPPAVLLVLNGERVKVV